MQISPGSIPSISSCDIYLYQVCSNLYIPLWPWKLGQCYQNLISSFQIRSVLWVVLSDYILVRLYCLMHTMVTLVFNEAHLGERYSVSTWIRLLPCDRDLYYLPFLPLTFSSITMMKLPFYIFYIVYIEILAFVLMHYGICRTRCRKGWDARLCRASYLFPQRRLIIYSILHEHGCRILFIIWY